MVRFEQKSLNGLRQRQKYIEIMCFELFFRHFVFNVDVDGSREKTIKDYIKVSVVANLECGNMQIKKKKMILSSLIICINCFVWI